MLHGMFGDWHLALAAYNWGEGSVKRAQAANRRAGRDTGYEQLHMPAETRNYVPKLQAIANIVRRPQEFGLALPPLENHPYFLTVEIDRDIDVALVTRLAGLTTEQFHQLNPQLNRPVILAAGTPQLLLPYDHANRFLRGLKAHRGPLATWTAWVAPKTLKAAEAARLVGMDEDELREVNRIPPRMLVKTGSTLLVPRTAGRTQDVTEHLADNATLALAPEASPHRRITVRAHRKGETVAALARRVGVPVAALAKWNGVAPGASFRPGHAVTVMVPAKATRVVRAVPSKRAARPASGTRTRVAQQAPPARR
jgi:membrane-bound lytic murein transglycosylase D